MVRSLYELVERDACTIWWYNRLPRPEIDVSSYCDKFFSATANSLRDHGRTLKVFDLTHDLGIAVVVAVSWRISDTMGLRLGLGAHPNLTTAATQALGELNQLAFVNDEATAFEPVPSHLRSSPSKQLLASSQEFREPPRQSDGESLEICLDHLRTRGLEVIVLDQTEPKTNIYVARVVVPGLRQMGARFAPGRLYDVPVKLRWRAEEVHEKELWDAATLVWPER
jgi:ribosomal protein S12 methylthiotransferase accessory factor